MCSAKPSEPIRQDGIHCPAYITERAISDLWFSSIFSKSIHATKTHNTSFWRSECGNMNLKGQKHSWIWDGTGLMFVKSVLFRKKGRGKSLKLPRPCPSRYLLSITIAKKWGIVVWSYRAALLGLASISVVPHYGCPSHYTDVGIRPFFHPDLSGARLEAPCSL